MGAIHKMAATFGDSPAARALRGNFYGQPGLPHLAKHFFPGFLVLLPEKSLILTKIFPARPPSRHNADFLLSQGYDIGYWKVWENLPLPATYDGRAEAPLAQVFRKDQTDFDARSDTTIARVPVCLQPPGRLFFVKFDSRTMETEHRLQFPMSMHMALTVVHMYQRVSQIWQTRGGRKTVTKANNRKHKTRTAKKLGVEPFSVGKTKPKPRCRLPPTTAVRVAALQCCTVVLSPTLLTVIDPKKNRNILLELFLWLDFSSSSNTEIVCKYHPNRI